MECILSNSIKLILIFLCVIIVLWLCQKMTLFGETPAEGFRYEVLQCQQLPYFIIIIQRKINCGKC